VTLIVQKPTGASTRLAKAYAEGDPLFSNVILLLHGNGADGSTTIIDSSPLSNAMQPVGNVQISTEQSKFGGSSIKFDGNGDGLASPANNFKKLWSFASVNHPVTVELWIRVLQLPTAGNVCRFITSSANPVFGGQTVYFQFDSEGRVCLTSNSPASILYSEQVISVNTWHHIAVVVNSINSYVFIDGVGTQSIEGFGPNASDTAPSNALFIGFDTTVGGNFNFNGYINDLRITRRIARYEDDFSPPVSDRKSVV
jgi:hypothetical protein